MTLKDSNQMRRTSLPAHTRFSLPHRTNQTKQNIVGPTNKHPHPPNFLPPPEQYSKHPLFFFLCLLQSGVCGGQTAARSAGDTRATEVHLAAHGVRSSSHAAFLILLSLRPPLPWTASSRAWHRPGWLLVVFIVHSPLGQTGTAHNTRRDASSLVEEGLEFEGGGLRGWLPWGLLVQRDRPEAAAAVLSGNNDNEPACSGRDGSD